MKKIIVVALLVAVLVGIMAHENLMKKEQEENTAWLQSTESAAPEWLSTTNKKQSDVVSPSRSHTNKSDVPQREASVANKQQSEFVLPSAKRAIYDSDVQERAAKQTIDGAENKNVAKAPIGKPFHHNDNKVAVNTKTAVTNRYKNLNSRYDSIVSENARLGDAKFESAIRDANEVKSLAIKQEMGSSHYAGLR